MPGGTVWDISRKSSVWSRGLGEGQWCLPPRPSEQQSRWHCRGNELGFQDQQESVWLWEAALGQNDEEMEYGGTCHSVSY